MIPFRGGVRRLLLFILAFVSFLAFAYEVIYRSNPYLKLSIRASSLPIKSSKEMNIWRNPNGTLASVVDKKLDIIYEQLNMSRTNVSRSIFPANQIGEYLMLNPNICTDAPIIDVIIIVHTAPSHFKRRKRMRHTFANRKLFLPKQIRIAFLLGRSKDKSLEEDMKTEHNIYNDTVMGDLYDDYHNLTLKGVMGYHWVGEYCPNSKVVLKVDDDVVIDMYSLLSRYMPHIEGKQKSIFCNTWKKHMHINRVGKWGVPLNLFNGSIAYPYFYCSGMAVLFTTDLMKPLYEAAKVTPFFWIDDLFLYGILPKVVGGITYYDYYYKTNISFYAGQTMHCFKERGVDCSIVATLVYDSQAYEIWARIRLLRNNTVYWNMNSFYEP